MHLVLVLLVACAPEEGIGAPFAASTGAESDPTTGPTPTTAPPTTGDPSPADDSSSGDEPGGTSGAASTGEAAPGCGDGVIDPGEACDDSFAGNREDAACLPTCVLAACGDGYVHAGVEDCDLGAGNSNAYGGCAPGTCLWGPRCGDGQVDPGDELCDPGVAVDPESEAVPCAATCRFAGRIVFLSSQTYTGDLGGVSGADLKCQALAKAFDPGRAHTYRAWISDSVSEPATTFAHGAMFTATPYVLRSGVEVAASFEDLILHGPKVGITLTDTLETLFDRRVWTHTTHAGVAVPDDHHCTQWSSKLFNLKGVVGSNGLPPDSPDLQTWTDERWWTRYEERNCNLFARLYCFEN
nr:DUF1554 domain-containing protein [Nannocystis sp.]